MTFRQFAFHNVFRNKRLYIAYFLSSMFTVMVFFTFANFAFHPTLTGEGMNASVTKGMLAAGTIIYIFSFFFIMYSMSAFLQSRKKEFGLLMMHGMSNGQVRWMVFLENMIIGFFATILGTGLGLVFSKVILLIAENVLVLEDSLDFYFPIEALLITFFSFIILFFLISVFVTFVLRTNKLAKLIKGDKTGKKEPKASILLTILAVVLLGSGYAIALIVEGPVVVFALPPVAGLVIVGTYLLFTQISVYVVRKLKATQSLFWKKTNMLLFSDLSYRMKDNARAFFMVAIISTVAFSAIGTLVGLNTLLTKDIKAMNPYSFSYIYNEDETKPNFNQTFDKYDLQVEEADVMLQYFEQDDETIVITTPETYNAYATLMDEQEIQLDTDDAIMVEKSAANMMPAKKNLEDQEILLADGTTQAMNKEKMSIAKPGILPVVAEYYIVGPDVFDQLPEPEYRSNYVVWDVIEGNEADIIDAGHEITEQDPSFMAIDATVYDLNKMWGPVMFVGFFIGIVFFVSAGSFLYFRLYSDLDDDKEKFTAINKIGLTKGEMNRVISKQMALLFFAPIVVALIHGAVALTALSHMFGSSLVYESTLVLGSFLGIQIVYFFIVRYFYIRQVRNHVIGWE